MGDKTLSPFAAPAERRSGFRQALPQVLAVCVKNVLLLGFGMTLGFPTILIPSLSGNNPQEKISLGQESISWIGSINLICVPVGAILSGVLTQPIGRKRSMQLVNIPFLCSWLLFHFSTESWHIFLALCITGFSGGLLEAPTLTYVAEITEPRYRGILASTSGVAVIVGIISQFLCGTFFHWRTVAATNCLIPVLSFLLLFFIPESPHWLILKNRLEAARSSIAWFRGWADSHEIEEEFSELQSQIRSGESPEHYSFWEKAQLFGQRKFYWPFCLITFAFFVSQFCGMTPLQIFAVKIFKTMQSPIDEYYATLAMGVAEASGCILSTCIVHFSGKRLINFFSLLTCAACFIVVATYAYIHELKYFDNDPVNLPEGIPNRWIPVTFLIGVAFFSHTGIKLLPWMLIGEVFSPDIRSTASGVSGALNYVFGFLSIKLFFNITFMITLSGAFWMYSGVCIFGAIGLYFFLPETEGKSLFEVTQHFAGKSKLGNKVIRLKDIPSISTKNVGKNGGVWNESFTPAPHDTVL